MLLLIQQGTMDKKAVATCNHVWGNSHRFSYPRNIEFDLKYFSFNYEFISKQNRYKLTLDLDFK